MPTSSERPLRIAFAITGGAGWIAGIHYFQNLFTAIRAVAGPEKLQLFLLPAEGMQDSDLASLMRFASGIIRTPNSDIDWLFSTAEYGPSFKVPLMSWIPDFQHKELPQFFSEVEIKARDTSYGAMAEHANRIVLSSNHAASVANKYYPTASDKLRVMPFVAQIPKEVFKIDLRKVYEKYSLPEKFVFLPNQLWKHKNHVAVIDAMITAVQEEPNLTIACSGATVDYRDKFHVPYLRSRIQAADLDGNIRILGMIPEEDVFGLMRQSVCILQPSLYEGWSTVVEQAKSLGKSMVVSNLPVHVEQNPPQSAFFDPHKPHDLARVLVETYKNRQAGPDIEMEKQAAASLPERTADYGQRFLALMS